MNVYITFDYEIFFGENHGTIERNLLIPTQKLMDIAKRNHAFFTFFIDCGFLLKMKELGTKYSNLAIDYQKVKQQIRLLAACGHDCQLHIHPHWEYTTYDGKCWNFDYSHYKLSDFPPEEIIKIVEKYIEELEQITQKKVTAYRAGGWCVQPFSLLKSSFKKQGIEVDSSVFKGGKQQDEYYNYDYTTAPSKAIWRFEDEVCKEVENGPFVELPIASYRYSPLFFWRLFILGNLFPKQHKPIGDGKPMPSSVTRKKMLTQFHFLSGNVDGYFVTKAQSIIRRNLQKKYGHTVFLGHPKAATEFAIRRIGKLIQKNADVCQFVTISQYHQIRK